MPDSENGTSSFGRESGYLGVLDNRISTVERGQKELSSDINALGGQFERSLKAAIDSFGRQMDALSAKVDERSKIPWPALGVMLSFITVIGGLVWYPVKDKQDKLEASIQRLADASIGKNELEQRLGTAAQRRDDFQRTTDSRAERQQRQIEDVEAKVVPLEWHKEKWTANDREFGGLRSDLNRTETNLQRQIDDIKRSFGDTFSLRDALLQMQKRIDTLESNNAVLKNR